MWNGIEELFSNDGIYDGVYDGIFGNSLNSHSAFRFRLRTSAHAIFRDGDHYFFCGLFFSQNTVFSAMNHQSLFCGLHQLASPVARILAVIAVVVCPNCACAAAFR